MAETLPQAAARFPAGAALIHLDIGGGNISDTERNASGVELPLLALLAEGGVVASDQPLPGLAGADGIAGLPLPSGVRESRYFLCRRSKK